MWLLNCIEKGLFLLSRWLHLRREEEDDRTPFLHFIIKITIIF